MDQDGLIRSPLNRGDHAGGDPHQDVVEEFRSFLAAQVAGDVVQGHAVDEFHARTVLVVFTASGIDRERPPATAAQHGLGENVERVRPSSGKLVHLVLRFRRTPGERTTSGLE